ncbi:MAG: hypothetical protein K2L71_04645 [Muribaculaceae bacterium]|nr:hypothetical protein [Muribaculaceae bacterium]
MDTNSTNEKKPRRPRIGGMIGSEPKDSRFEKVNYGSQEQNDNTGNDTSLQQPRQYQPRYNNNLEENSYQPRYNSQNREGRDLPRYKSQTR